jgi:hypothetical protein
MLSYDKLPLGYYFDADGIASTDNVLIAHQLKNGTWSQNRSVTVDTDGKFIVGKINTGNLGDNYADLESLVAALKTTLGLQECNTVSSGTACLAGTTAIDDLAKINLTFFLDPTEYKGEQFTLRYATSLVSSEVPEPGALALVMLGLGALGVTARRRRKTA